MDRVARRGPLARAPGALKSHNAEKLKGGTLWGSSTSILSQNMKNLRNFFFGKKSHNTEKTERRNPLRFSNIHSDAKQQKIEGGTIWGNFFSKKSLAVPKKNERGDPLVSPGMVCYAEKQEKPFWFSSLGQIVQFGVIIF